MIQSKCKSCGAVLKAPDHLAGKEIKCPKCSVRVTLPAAAPGASAPDDDKDVSAKDLLSEIKGKPHVAAAPPRPAAVVKGAGAPAEKEKKAEAPAKRPAPMPVAERGFPIVNLIVSAVGILVIAATVYIIWQKNTESQENERAKKTVKSLREQLGGASSAMKAAKELADKADLAKAKEALEDVESKVGRVVKEVDIELGNAATSFAKEQRDALLQEARGVKEEVEKLLSGITQRVEEGQAVAKFLAEREKEVASVAEGLQKAQQQIKKEEYVEAKRTLTKAKSGAEDAIEAIEEHEGDFKNEEAAKKVAAFKLDVEKQIKTIKQLLGSEEIVQGGRGLVKFENSWVTPEDKKKAEEAKRQAAAPKPAGAAPPTPTFKADDMEWMIDDMSGALMWARQNWGDPAEISIQESSGNKALFIRYQVGDQRKVAVARGMRIDASTRGMLLVDVENRGDQPVNLCLAVMTDQFYESQAQQIPCGATKNVTFSLSGACYKCAKDNWQNYTFEIGNPNSLGQIIFMIYPPTAGTLVLDNVRMISK